MRSKFLSREDVERAQKYTKSNKAAARFLGCSYTHYQMYAKLYKDNEGNSLWMVHRNRGAEGVGRLGYNIKKGQRLSHPLTDILNGLVPFNYSENLAILKHKLIYEGFLIEHCYCCGFKEKRVTDLKIPLIFNYKDGNKNNWKLENLEFNCYNCYFLNVGNVFSDNELKAIEDYSTTDHFKQQNTPTMDYIETINKIKKMDDLDSVMFPRK
jgi:hypothetical protein